MYCSRVEQYTVYRATQQGFYSTHKQSCGSGAHRIRIRTVILILDNKQQQKHRYSCRNTLDKWWLVLLSNLKKLNK